MKQNIKIAKELVKLAKTLISKDEIRQDIKQMLDKKQINKLYNRFIMEKFKNEEEIKLFFDLLIEEEEFGIMSYYIQDKKFNKLLKEKIIQSKNATVLLQMFKFFENKKERNEILQILFNKKADFELFCLFQRKILKKEQILDYKIYLMNRKNDIYTKKVKKLQDISL